jgi:hypothetical protein
MRERRLGMLTVAKQSQIESSYGGIAANSATLAIYEGTRQNRTVLCAKAGVPCGSRLAKTVRSAVFSDGLARPEHWENWRYRFAEICRKSSFFCNEFRHTEHLVQIL